MIRARAMIEAISNSQMGQPAAWRMASKWDSWMSKNQ
jgi:hypothetical protein